MAGRVRIDDKSTVVQVMLNWWQAITWDSVDKGTRPQWVNSSSPGQNGRHFADDIFKCIFLNEKVWFLTEISLKFVPKGPIDNNPALV